MSNDIAEIKAAIERYERYYAESPKPEYWQHLINLRAKLRQIRPQLFRRVKLKAA